MSTRGEWRSAMVECGAQCVTTVMDGRTVAPSMLESSVDNLDYQQVVSIKCTMYTMQAKVHLYVMYCSERGLYS